MLVSNLFIAGIGSIFLGTVSASFDFFGNSATIKFSSIGSCAAESETKVSASPNIQSYYVQSNRAVATESAILSPTGFVFKPWNYGDNAHGTLKHFTVNRDFVRYELQIRNETPNTVVYQVAWSWNINERPMLVWEYKAPRGKVIKVCRKVNAAFAQHYIVTVQAYTPIANN